ncbi:MAG: hypothetical protein COA66_14460 [Arcobacter sp.]|nr:MAG: hypothetical protein COA66_14460 [Arcobacter sp.]
MLQEIKLFDSRVWYIIIQTFFNRFTMFMVWPFLALILYDDFNLNELEIGFFLSSSLLIGIIVGFFAGNLSDRIGREKVILAGLLISVFAMALMAFSSTLEGFFIGTSLQAIGRSLIENPSKALMTDTLVQQKTKELSLHLRYYAINVGSAFGPMVGISLGLTASKETFLLVSLISFFSFLTALYLFKDHIKNRKKEVEKATNFKFLYSILKQDHAFLLFILANALTMIAFMQIDSSMLQYLRMYEFEELTALFASLIFANGMTIIIFQFPLLRLLKNVSVFNRAFLGVCLFIVAFIVFANVEPKNAQGIMFAVLILSMGECILFPTVSIIIDTMAPKHLKGSYYGVAEVSLIGIVLAPVVGGFLLQIYGGFVLWITMCVLSCCVAVLLFLAKNAKRPDFIEEERENTMLQECKETKL